VDEFAVEAVTLKKLKKIRIGHNGERPGSGWFLDKVVVHPADEPSDAIVFECNRYQSYVHQMHRELLQDLKFSSDFHQNLAEMADVSVNVNVTVEFKVTLHEQVRCRGTLQY